MNQTSYLRASARWLAAGVGVTAAAYGAYVGMTRYRYGDAAPLAFIELVERDVAAKGQDSGPVMINDEDEAEG